MKLDDFCLTGWKTIADYLGVSVWTAKRWYRHRGLPVYSLGGKVSALKFEIVVWMKAYSRLLDQIRAEEASNREPLVERFRGRNAPGGKQND